MSAVRWVKSGRENLFQVGPIRPWPANLALPRPELSREQLTPGQSGITPPGYGVHGHCSRVLCSGRLGRVFLRKSVRATLRGTAKAIAGLIQT